MVFQQALAGASFVLDDLGDHDVLEVIDDLFLCLTERRLIGDLIEIARRFRTLPVESPHGQAHVLGSSEDPFDLARESQGRQMQHHGNTDARPDVGRAGGKVPVTRIERVVEAFLEHVVNAADLCPGFVELEPAAKHLYAQVVLFVDHQRGGLGRCDDHTATALTAGMLSADQVPLHKDLAIDFIRLFDVHVEQLITEFSLANGLPKHALYLSTLSLGALGKERPASQVPSEADPR